MFFSTADCPGGEGIFGEGRDAEGTPGGAGIVLWGYMLRSASDVLVACLVCRESLELWICELVGRVHAGRIGEGCGRANRTGHGTRDQI